MDFDDLDDVEETVGAEVAAEQHTKLDDAREAGFAPSREIEHIDGLYCFSDANCDEKGSQTFIRRLTLPGEKKQEIGSLNRIATAALIVAGGIARNPNDLHTAFQVMSTRVSNIHFVPGAVELHIKSDADFNDLPADEKRYHNSYEKVKYLMSSFSKHAGITATPQVYECGGEALWVVPLISHSSPTFDAEADQHPGSLGDVPAGEIKDLDETVWPADMDPSPDASAVLMDSLNEWLLDQMPEEDRTALLRVLSASKQERTAASTRIVTFSHFVPRPELVPERRFFPNPTMAGMMGSASLQKRVTSMKPDVHVFGRSCFAWDAIVGGTRFITAPLGTLERRLLGDSAIGEFPNFETSEPLMLRQDDSWAGRYTAGWSEYYRTHEREARGPAASRAREELQQLLPAWVHQAIKAQAEGYCSKEGQGHSGFAYGRV